MDERRRDYMIWREDWESLKGTLNSISTDVKLIQQDASFTKEKLTTIQEDVEKLDHSVHGNGDLGLKTEVASQKVAITGLKERVAYVITAILMVGGAVVNDYVRRG